MAIAEMELSSPLRRRAGGPSLLRPWMTYKETFWMACDTIDHTRAEYGPFNSRLEAELEARKLGFPYLLRYEHEIGDNDEIQDVRVVFIELPEMAEAEQPAPLKLYTRCATCGEAASHEKSWQAEVWADIHEFEHCRHMVRLFEQTRADGLKEVVGWRQG
ncbi:MAG TPA: hypothetical protein VKT29_02320 [Terriglobales bacterium]|nr:hypothetical protein [Terriglobales bacterium]